MASNAENIRKSMRFITDEKGKQSAVILDLKNKYVKDIVEDLLDTIVATDRLQEPTASYNKVRQNYLKKKKS